MFTCRRGDFVDCANLKTPGINMDGGYAEYMIAPIEALALIPDELTSSRQRHCFVQGSQHSTRSEIARLMAVTPLPFLGSAASVILPCNLP